MQLNLEYFYIVSLVVINAVNSYNLLYFLLIFFTFFILVAEQLQAQHSAIKMLHSRVHLILDYVRAVKEGKVAPNHEILREAYSLCHRLPVISNETFKEEYFNVSMSNQVSSLQFYLCRNRNYKRQSQYKTILGLRFWILVRVFGN